MPCECVCVWNVEVAAAVARFLTKLIVAAFQQKTIAVYQRLLSSATSSYITGRLLLFYGSTSCRRLRSDTTSIRRRRRRRYIMCVCARPRKSAHTMEYHRQTWGRTQHPIIHESYHKYQMLLFRRFIQNIFLAYAGVRTIPWSLSFTHTYTVNHRPPVCRVHSKTNAQYPINRLQILYVAGCN